MERRYRGDFAFRPGTVRSIKGIIFQNDGASPTGRLFIRPLESVDRLIAGITMRPGTPQLAMHTGIHVVLDDAREFVVEQLVGTFTFVFRNGLNWTPLDVFKQRDRGGWDVTVDPLAFRGIDPTIVAQTTRRLNAIEGHPFLGEDCTAFVERAFGDRRLFADSPLLQSLGVGARIGDPALPLLRTDATLDERTRRLLQVDCIRNLRDPDASVNSPNAWLWANRGVAAAALILLARALYSSASRKSTPISSTARRFFK